MENHKHVSSHLKSKTKNPKMKNDKNKVETTRVRKKKIHDPRLRSREENEIEREQE